MRHTPSALSSLLPHVRALYGAPGKHLRHARDHFSLLIDTMEAQPPYILNYDVRSRNQPMETSRRAAHDALRECIVRLENMVPSQKMDEPVTLNAVTPYPQTMQSTFGREVSVRGYSYVAVLNSHP